MNMNNLILNQDVQQYIDENLSSDPHKIALAKPRFNGISQAALVEQIIAKKKAKTKLPSWFNTQGIYYPPLLSMEQCSSETTARYKAGLMKARSLVDITAGFGVDSAAFARRVPDVVSCEKDTMLSAICEYNAGLMGFSNQKCLPLDGLDFLQATTTRFDAIYVDPARRNGSQKVYQFKDCLPDVTSVLDLLLEKADEIVVKAAPFLDLQAGLNELRHVREIHIVSTRNECKELLWFIDKKASGENPTITCATLNQTEKLFSFSFRDIALPLSSYATELQNYVYEPDAALLKSGAFNYIALHFGLQKLHPQSHLYCSDILKSEFPGRIFKVDAQYSPHALKKEKELHANIIVRNFPEKPEILAKHYRVKPHNTNFILFTQSMSGYIAIKAQIVQYY